MLELNRLMQNLGLEDPDEIRQATMCWEWGRGCAKHKHLRKTPPLKPPLILPDRARSGVIWAHCVMAGIQYGEEEVRYAEQNQAE